MTQPFQEIATKYNLLNDLMSLGLHRFWKNILVRTLIRDVKPGAKILDVAAGTGDVASLFLSSIPATQIYALDPCEAMMNEGKRKYPQLKNWYRAEAEELPFLDRNFSIVTCTFGIRNFRNRGLAFKEIARVLEPGGRFGILEIYPIPAHRRYLPFRLFWKVGIPLWGRLFKQLKAYQYLRDTGARFISPEVMVEELSSDFELIQKKPLIGGGLVTLTIVRRR
jgi:demethylmenaquinone methyltransferase / 2-methoxy-6-polyprenyl-1,4-benzoquinol methylase